MLYIFCIKLKVTMVSLYNARLSTALPCNNIISKILTSEEIEDLRIHVLSYNINMVINILSRLTIEEYDAVAFILIQVAHKNGRTSLRDRMCSTIIDGMTSTKINKMFFWSLNICDRCLYNLHYYIENDEVFNLQYYISIAYTLLEYIPKTTRNIYFQRAFNTNYIPEEKINIMRTMLV